MKIVIDVPEKVYNHFCRCCRFPDEVQEAIIAITDGTPLPKGHERLIILSEDAVKRERVPMDCSCQFWISDIGLSNATVAIIEADKE